MVAMMFAGPLMADSVYTWIDENGVRHYSNTGIPSGVQEATERPEEFSSPPPAATNDTDEPKTDNDRPPESPPGEDAGEGAPGPEDKGEMDPALAAKVEKERERLEAEIKRIKGLSIGVSFTQGMKDAQIRPLEEQLALLNADPKRYFRMKREGAFDRASGSGSGAAAPAASGPISDSLETFESSSATGRSEKDEAAPPREETKEKAPEQASSEEDKGGRARSNEPGATLRLPDGQQRGGANLEEGGANLGQNAQQ